MNPKLITKDFNKTHFSRRKNEKEKFNFWVTSTYVTLLSIIWLLLVYYVWILNVNATQWYNIIQLEREKKNLLLEKQKIYAKIAELESLSNIMNEEDTKNMEKIEDPDYVVIKDDVQYVYKY